MKKRMQRVLTGPLGTLRSLRRHPRAIATAIGTALATSLWLIGASAVHLSGAVASRVATLAQQPLVAGHTPGAVHLTAVQAVGLTYIFATLFYSVALFFGYAKLDRKKDPKKLPIHHVRNRFVLFVTWNPTRFRNWARRLEEDLARRLSENPEKKFRMLHWKVRIQRRFLLGMARLTMSELISVLSLRAQQFRERAENLQGLAVALVAMNGGFSSVEARYATRLGRKAGRRRRRLVILARSFEMLKNTMVGLTNWLSTFTEPLRNRATRLQHLLDRLTDLEKHLQVEMKEWPELAKTLRRRMRGVRRRRTLLLSQHKVLLVLASFCEVGTLRRLIRQLARWERRWWAILTVVPFLLFLNVSALLSQYGAAKLPFAAYNALTTYGPLTLSFWIGWQAWKVTRSKVNTFKLIWPLLSVIGSSLMIPWASADHRGMMAALLGALCAAGMVHSGITIAQSGIAIRGSYAATVLGCLLGIGPVLGIVHWTPEVIVRGAIAGALTFGSNALYNWAQAGLHLPRRIAAALGANGPSVSALAALAVLHQNLATLTICGACVILASSIGNAATTGDHTERNAHK